MSATFGPGFGPSEGLHVCWLSRRKAMEHARRSYNVADGVRLGWTPYRILITSFGGTAHSAFVTAREFRTWLRTRGARVEMKRNFMNIRTGTVRVPAVYRVLDGLRSSEAVPF